MVYLILYCVTLADKCDDFACQGGSCKVEDHKPICTCAAGFTLNSNVCEDINECLDNPCSLHAECENTPGSYTCKCINGTILDVSKGTCKVPGDCFTNNDCSDKTMCVNNQCVNPCQKSSPCGENAQCIVESHNAICECLLNSQGDPYKKCTKFECTKDADCSSEEACVNNKCINSCSIPRACGRNADCFSRSHIGHCSCSPGYTGDPVLGCVPIQYCTNDNRCSTGTKCVDNLCVGVYDTYNFALSSYKLLNVFYSFLKFYIHT